ncbi:hypothetical protein [Acrocarpospora catenulata]|nr:hypothetical protein [Acrocarpospora catenulata]
MYATTGLRAGVFHRHEWQEIERIGRVVTSWCPCGKTKTRVVRITTI